MKRSPVTKILFIYLLLSITTLLIWTARDINPVTGDEPHYLIMANGLVQHHTFEQTSAYQDEFKTRKIFKQGLAASDAQLTPENSHAIAGPHGKYNVHNIGLPLLIAIPFLYGGTLGAKLFMVFCSAGIILASWNFSSLFSKNERHRFWAVMVICISMPFIPASSQIYPDILAGMIILTGLYWCITPQQKRSSLHEFLLALVIVFLPWLQIKFAVSCAIIVLTVASNMYRESKEIGRVLKLLLVASISCTLLAIYNNYAFGKISGPYQSDAMEISTTSLMVLFGLYFDQNQGFLLQNPVNLIGVLAIAWFYRFNKRFALTWGLIFSSLIVPNAMHPSWYGGTSFSGRFAWAGASIFIIPTIYGLIRIAETKEKLFKIIVCVSVLLQLCFFYLYAIIGVNSYKRAVDTWFDSYSIYYLPVHSWLPMFYNTTWAFSYAPNYMWAGFITTVFIMGFPREGKVPVFIRYAVLAFGLSIVLVGFHNNHPDDDAWFQAIDLPSQSGRLKDSTRIGEQGIDESGFITYGPYLLLGKGQYEVTVKYSSVGTSQQSVGWFDVYDATSGKQDLLRPLYGTNNAIQELKIEFANDQWVPHTFEFRNKWNGISNIRIYGIHVQKKYDPKPAFANAVRQE
ncbi:hypothetical protein [Undibacterium sp. TJN19]|uniref:hypothetical protein n=1 Tax=Undibacterium sp. TJN19 TaxID=3413055 RepID=UPI003BF4338C